MATVLREVSKITAKGQTTVPKSVRQALGVDYGDEIAFHIDDDRGVVVTRAETADTDPVIDSFLSFIARDMEERPETIGLFPAELASRAKALTQGIVFNLDDEIDGEVDL